MRSNSDIGTTKPSRGDAAFDYGEVSAPIARFLRGQADRIRRTVGTSIIQLGTDLIEAKRYLSHGSFLGWVELEVGIPARTAQAYMRVAQWAHEKGGNVARLPPSLLHLLSAPSTPTAFAHAVLRKIDGGEKVTVTEVRSELKALRQARQERSLIGFQPRTKANDPGQPLSFDGDGSAALRQAVVILARGLSRSDLAQVCRFMTSRLVLDDPSSRKALPRPLPWQGESLMNRSSPKTGRPMSSRLMMRSLSRAETLTITNCSRCLSIILHRLCGSSVTTDD
jgi:Protein of unknown function (DUF3102)